jgi:CO dehydrogenase/acetyl-CoA synthase epsilon subunit
LSVDRDGNVNYDVVLLVICLKQLAHRCLDVIAHLHDNLLIGPPATGGRDLLMPV